MKPQTLIAAGLQPQQASAYALLLDTGQILPSDAAKKLGTTRTNAYKILDRLVELGLANKAKVNNKYVYLPSNPFALTHLVNEARNKVVAQEEAVKQVMDQLLAKYYEKTEQPTVSVVTGRKAVAQAFKQQIDLERPVYFVRTPADIPSMTFEAMHDIRIGPSHYKQPRFGITPTIAYDQTEKVKDDRSNLTRTWVSREAYTAPVEWSVSGGSLLIVLFGDEPHAITIVNPMIADAFLQLWHIMDSGLRAMKNYP